MRSKDILWKGIIEECIEMFLQFFFPAEFHLFDLSRPVEFLEQELQQLYPEGEAMNRHLDKLCKLYLKDGTEYWILIHIEVQGYLDLLFPKRMFQYFYRSFDRFDKPIVAIAIFTDDNKNFHPKSFEMELLGTKQSYTFNTYKVLEQSEEELLASDNPFAMVVLTVLRAIKGGKYNKEQLYNIKWSIAKRLLEMRYDKSKLDSLFIFMNHYLSFDSMEENSIFAERFAKENHLKSNNMGVREIVIEEYKKELIELGMEKGMEKGMERGVLNAAQKGMPNADIAYYFDITLEEVVRILSAKK